MKLPFRRAALAAAALSLSACSSGSCAGLSPLETPFPPEEGVDNAASVNITSEGFAFLSANAPALVAGVTGGSALSFEIPESSGSIFSVIDYTICLGGPDPAANPPTCQVGLDLANAALTAAPSDPHAISISGPIPFLLSYLPVHIEAGCAPIVGCLAKSDVVLSIDESGACPGTTYSDLTLTGLDVNLAVDKVSSHLRHGYTATHIEDVDDKDIDTQGLIAAMHFCPQDPQNTDDTNTADVFNTYKDLVFFGMKADLYKSLNENLGALTCQAADPMAPSPCPNGTSADANGICVYSDGTCITSLVGVDGRVDLGGLLASLVTGTRAEMDLVLAAGGLGVRDDGSGELWGDLRPVAGGATLGFLGGAKPVPQALCVPPSGVKAPTDIPVPDELLGTPLANWPASLGAGPHLGLALSERFLTYAMANVYDSGALCLGLSGTALNALSPIPLSSASGSLLGAPSLRDLGIQRESSEIVMYLHPLTAPTMAVGSGQSEDDPLLRLTLPNMALDLYVWSSDRFVRAFSVTMTLDVDLGLTADTAGITPTLDGIHVRDVSATSSSILGDPAEPIATAVEGLITDLLGSSGLLDQSLPTIDLGSLLGTLGISVSIPPEGIRKLTKGNDDFVGLFATLSVAGP